MSKFGEGVDWDDPVLANPNVFHPSRLEWLMSGILSGLLAGAAPKNRVKCVAEALEIALEVERQLDAEKTD